MYFIDKHDRSPRGRRYETLSARCYRSDWKLQRVIDWTFALWGDTDHCRRIYELERKLGIQPYSDKLVRKTL